MSIVGGQTNKNTNPSYLAGLPLGKKIMSILGGHTNKCTNQSNFFDMWGASEISDALINYSVGTFVREKSSKSKLHGGMYSANNN